MDGIIVTTSRQAIHEVLAELATLRTRAEAAEARVAELEAVERAARRLRDDLKLRAQVKGTDTVSCGIGVWDEINDALTKAEG
jgi:multidrug efflux pump subunit AcrA (membrane-fusion protein)